MRSRACTCHVYMLVQREKLVVPVVPVGEQ